MVSPFGVFRTHRLLFDAATPAVGLFVLFGTLLALTLADATRNRKALQAAMQRQREESARVAGEMQAAQRIQLDTLPQPESAARSAHRARRVDGAGARGRRRPLRFLPLDERRLFFMLGDVSGKGLSASIFMAVSKALCKSTMLRARDADLGALMRRRTREVSRDNPGRSSSPCSPACSTSHRASSHYCNAGQENPWLRSTRRRTRSRA